MMKIAPDVTDPIIIPVVCWLAAALVVVVSVEGSALVIVVVSVEGLALVVVGSLAVLEMILGSNVSSHL